MTARRTVRVEPEAQRWVIVDESGRSKPFDRRGDAEARAATRAREAGAELIVEDDTGEIDRRRLVLPDERRLRGSDKRARGRLPGRSRR